MESKGSLPCSQQPAICPNPKHKNAVHATPPYFLKIHFNIILPSSRRSSKWSLSLGFLTETLCVLYVPHVLPLIDLPRGISRVPVMKLVTVYSRVIRESCHEVW